MGHIFLGGLGPELLAQVVPPLTCVEFVVPMSASALLGFPFELAHLDGRPLVEQGIRLIYRRLPRIRPFVKTSCSNGLRILAIFSTPDDTDLLDVRRERYALTRLVSEISETHGVAIELRVLQYGVTREILADALADGDGWDIIHFSGHGRPGELLLETADGSSDLVTTDDLTPVFQLTRDRLKLLTLSACSSAESVRPSDASSGMPDSPGLAMALADALGCSVVAMRYPLPDAFAIDLMACQYRNLLKHRQPLPRALHLAAVEAANASKAPHWPVALATPLLCSGDDAAGQLRLIPPGRTSDFSIPRTGLFGFPGESELFVGRLAPMLRATRALAPRSPFTGILLFGPPGHGKTACATELAYRHEQQRFTGHVWFEIPAAPVLTELLPSFLGALAIQLDLKTSDLLSHIDDPTMFAERIVQRIRYMLAKRAVLIIVDRADGLLGSSGAWRDERWGPLLHAFLDHGGLSRLILTCRTVPPALGRSPRLLLVELSAMKDREARMLLAGLPNFRRLIEDPASEALSDRVRTLAKGSPRALVYLDQYARTTEELEHRLHELSVEITETGPNRFNLPDRWDPHIYFSNHIVESLGFRHFAEGSGWQVFRGTIPCERFYVHRDARLAVEEDDCILATGTPPKKLRRPSGPSFGRFGEDPQGNLWHVDRTCLHVLLDNRWVPVSAPEEMSAAQPILASNAVAPLVLMHSAREFAYLSPIDWRWSHAALPFAADAVAANATHTYAANSSHWARRDHRRAAWSVFPIRPAWTSPVLALIAGADDSIWLHGGVHDLHQIEPGDPHPWLFGMIDGLASNRVDRIVGLPDGRIACAGPGGVACSLPRIDRSSVTFVTLLRRSIDRLWSDAMGRLWATIGREVYCFIEGSGG